MLTAKGREGTRRKKAKVLIKLFQKFGPRQGRKTHRSKKNGVFVLPYRQKYFKIEVQ